MALHKDLTGADLHEPKGASSASINTTYFSDGAGSGTWRKVGLSDLSSAILGVNTFYLSVKLDDISTASSVFVPIVDDSSIVSATIVLGGAITSSDATLSFTRTDGSSLGSTITIPESGSAAGDSFSFTATTNQAIASSGFVKIETDGASTNVASVFITLKFTRTS